MVCRGRGSGAIGLGPEHDRMTEVHREDEALVVKCPWLGSFRAVISSLGLIGWWSRDLEVGPRIYEKKRERDSLVKSCFAMW